MSLLRHRDDLANAESFAVVGEQFAEASLLAVPDREPADTPRACGAAPPAPQPRPQPEDRARCPAQGRASPVPSAWHMAEPAPGVPRARSFKRTTARPAGCWAGCSAVATGALTAARWRLGRP